MEVDFEGIFGTIYSDRNFINSAVCRRKFSERLFLEVFIMIKRNFLMFGMVIACALGTPIYAMDGGKEVKEASEVERLKRLELDNDTLKTELKNVKSSQETFKKRITLAGLMCGGFYVLTTKAQKPSATQGPQVLALEKGLREIAAVGDSVLNVANSHPSLAMATAGISLFGASRALKPSDKQISVNRWFLGLTFGILSAGVGLGSMIVAIDTDRPRLVAGGLTFSWGAANFAAALLKVKE